MTRSLQVFFTLLLMSVAAVAVTPPLKSASDLLNAGRADDAISVLDSHLQSAPEDAAAYNLLARTYFSLQRWDRAIAAGEKAVALAPQNSSYHMWLGRVYGEKANHSSFITAARMVKKIRSEFELAVELDASNVDARTDLAEFYIDAPSFMGGGTDKALRQAEFMARSDSAVAHWIQARVYDKNGADAEAEREFKAAILESGDDARYMLELASFYAGHGRLAEMESTVNQAVQAQRRKPVNMFDAASLLVSAGRNFAGAAQMIGKYLAGSTTAEAPAFQAHYILGLIHEKEGNKAAAAAEYRAALALARDYDEARIALARVAH